LEEEERAKIERIKRLKASKGKRREDEIFAFKRQVKVVH